MANDKDLKKKILSGRKAVTAYRTAHSELYSNGWHEGLPEEHTPLLNKLLDKLRKDGFNSPQEFFVASELLNIKELGFSSKEDFTTRATEDDRQALSRMWH